MMALDETGKTAALAGSNDVNQFVRIENADHHLIPGVRSFVTLNHNFPNEPGGRDIRLLEMARHRLVHAFRLDEFNETKLDGIVSILLLRLLLYNHAGTGLNDGDRNDGAVILQQLRHSDFLTE